MTQGKDEDYEPIGGINLQVRGDGGSEEWDLPIKHFDTEDDLVRYIRRNR